MVFNIDLTPPVPFASNQQWKVAYNDGDCEIVKWDGTDDGVMLDEDGDVVEFEIL